MDIFLSEQGRKTPLIKACLNLLIVTVVIVAVFWIALSRIGVTFNFGFLYGLRTRIGQGFAMTVALSLASLVCSLILGVAGAAASGSRVIALRFLARGYINFIRGTPLITQIYLFFYIVGTAFGVENRFISGVLTLSVFEGAYIAEIIRGSLLSIDKSQLEAASAVGFTKAQTLRYVILPQLVARTIPALTGQFASIIKDSSLLSIISIIELTQVMKEISAMNLKLFECYLLLGALYLCLTLPITFASKALERRFHYEA